MIALRSATSPFTPELPRSRTVVMPASRSSRPSFAPSNARSAVLWVATIRSASRSWCMRFVPSMLDSRCVCTSMNPGSNVEPPRSMTLAPAGIFSPDPTAVILPPCTSRTAFEIEVSARPSMSRAARIAMIGAPCARPTRGAIARVTATARQPAARTRRSWHLRRIPDSVERMMTVLANPDELERVASLHEERIARPSQSLQRKRILC